MITVTQHALDTIGIRTSSVIGAIQDVREFAERDGNDPSNLAHRACNLIGLLLNCDMKFDDLIAGIEDKYAADYPLMVAQAVAEDVVKHVGVPIDEAEVLAHAKHRVGKLIHLPQHQCWFARPEVTSVSTIQQAVAAGIETKVAVKADGTIKKGGREILAQEMYKKHILNATTPITNQEFIKLLVKELGMTKPGATTYAWNCKKKLGAPPGMEIKPKGKKS